MTWYANQIYARPTREVIAAFRTLPFMADQLYHVDDMRGIRSEWTRATLDSGGPPWNGKHGLPGEGVLVVSPEIYQTGYDRKDPDAASFERHDPHNRSWPRWPPGDKWRDVRAPEATQAFFPEAIDPEEFSLAFLECLTWVSHHTSSPLVYYQCAMWGGDVERETAWVLDANPRVYEFKDERTVLEHTRQGTMKTHGDLLQLAMRAVGVELPTRFFALHETSFNWPVYRLAPTAE